jgi:hypothetical protein
VPPPQKVFKNINHRDTMYRWIMQNRTGTSELVIELMAAVNGQVFIAQLPKVVSHNMVTLGIDFGRANGWKPEEAGEPFRCKWLRGSFHVTPADA